MKILKYIRLGAVMYEAVFGLIQAFLAGPKKTDTTALYGLILPVITAIEEVFGVKVDRKLAARMVRAAWEGWRGYVAEGEKAAFADFDQYRTPTEGFREYESRPRE